MRRLAIVFLATTAIGVASTASAADMPTKVPAPVVARAYDWTGFYIGGHRGYGWSQATGTISALPPSVFDQGSFDLDGDGVVGGAQIGYNWQFNPNWVIGVEADISGTGISGSSFSPVTVGGAPFGLSYSHYMSKEIDWLASVRGRLGYTWDRWMIYATGGVAWTEVSGDLIGRTVPQISNTRGSYSTTNTGWTAGGGLEWAFANNWTARAEYLYYHFDGDTVTAADVLNRAVTFTTDDTNVHVLRAGVNYKFGGYSSAPDMPVKAASRAVAPHAWTGFYLGGHVGYGWSDANAIVTPLAPLPSFDEATFNLDGKGIVGGVQGGYNLQVAPSWVVGIEGDYSGTGIRGSSFADVAFGGGATGADHYMSREIEWMATLRGRLGYAADRWMVYGTGGVAWAKVKGDVFTNRPFAQEVSGSYSETNSGWTAGGGIEWAFANNWTARAEYLHYRFDGDTVIATDKENAGLSNSYTTGDMKVNVVRVGVNYKFGGFGKAPVVAKY
jgi:outer membrane immunogenic protein